MIKNKKFKLLISCFQKAEGVHQDSELLPGAVQPRGVQEYHEGLPTVRKGETRGTIVKKSNNKIHDLIGLTILRF